MVQHGRTSLSLSALRRNYAHPHALYALFQKNDSIHFDTTSNCWIVTGHAAILRILSDSRFFSMPGTSDSTRHSLFHMIHNTISQQMLFMDGEKHQRMQRVIQSHLVKITRTIEPVIRSIVQERFQLFLKVGSMDIVKDLAAPVSFLTTAHIMGLPFNDYSMLGHLEVWSDTFSDITSGYLQGNVQDILALKRFFSELITQRRVTPETGFIDDWMQLTDIFDTDALISNCMMILSASRITTKKLLGNGIPLLFPYWGSLQAAMQENGQLLKLVGEEMLRIVTPTRYLARWASEDIDLSEEFPGDHLIRRGQKILLFLEAGNYDPHIFAQADRFDLQRRPNKHLSFGHGEHMCPGAALARLETRVVLETFLGFANLRPKLVEHIAPIWSPNPNIGGFSSCQIVLR